MIPHARSLTNFVKSYEHSEEVSNVCRTLVKKVGGACERRLYNDNNNLDLNDNKLLLVATTFDPRYRLSAFPSYLKNNVKELLKLNIKIISVVMLIKVVIFLYCYQINQITTSAYLIQSSFQLTILCL